MGSEMCIRDRGNIVGGALMVGLVYWFVYLRPKQMQTPQTTAKPMAAGK